MRRSAAGAWRRWLKFAEIFGNIQLSILLSVVYWTMLLIVAIPFKLFADPLALSRSSAVRWTSRNPNPQTLESMRRQERTD